MKHDAWSDVNHEYDDYSKREKLDCRVGVCFNEFEYAFSGSSNYGEAKILTVRITFKIIP